jgi:hypothetical protein
MKKMTKKQAEKFVRNLVDNSLYYAFIHTHPPEEFKDTQSKFRITIRESVYKLSGEYPSRKFGKDWFN